MSLPPIMPDHTDPLTGPDGNVDPDKFREEFDDMAEHSGFIHRVSTGMAPLPILRYYGDAIGQGWGYSFGATTGHGDGREAHHNPERGMP